MTEGLIKTFVKDYENVKSLGVRDKYGSLASTVGIICNLILFMAKMALGIFSGSIAITADAFNNLSDIGSNVVAFLGFKLASQPADENHPFGHGRFEYLSGLLVSIFVILVGVEIVKGSIEKIITPGSLEFSWVVLVALLMSIGLKLWLGMFYEKISKRINSSSLSANSADCKSDCISTGATVIGLLVFYFLEINIDGYLGLLVGLVILWSGYKIVMETITPLLGCPPDEEMVKKVQGIMESYPVCQGIHDMIIHDYGPGRLMGSAHMEVPCKCDILDAHDQIDNAEKQILKELHMSFVIHMDPIETECPEIIKYKAIVEDVLISISEDLSFHDFRMVKGDTHSNLIFDIVIPNKFTMTNIQIKKIIDCALRASGDNIYTAITYDRSYIG